MKQEPLFESSRAPLVIEPQISIMLLMERTRMGMQRKVDLSKIPDLPSEMKAELVSATAKIIDCPELRTIMGLDSDINAWLKRNALPSVFRFGAHLISKTLVPACDAKLMDYRDKRLNAIPAFVARYRDVTAAAREKLGPMLSAAIQWPDPALVPQLFTLRWRWVQISIPFSLEEEMRMRELAKESQDMERQTAIVQAALRTGFKELVDRMIARLQPNALGKKPIIRDSLVDNMKEFLSAFPDRYIADDSELKALVEKAMTVMNGVTPEDLRGNSDLQGFLVKEFSRIDAELEPLVEQSRASRVITFEDDSESIPA